MPKTMFITREKKVGETKIGGHEAVVITIEGREIFRGGRDEQEQKWLHEGRKGVGRITGLSQSDFRMEWGLHCASQPDYGHGSGFAVLELVYYVDEIENGRETILA